MNETKINSPLSTGSESFKKVYKLLTDILGIIMCLISLIWLIPGVFIGQFSFVTTHFMFGMLMCYLIYDVRAKATYYTGPRKLVDIALAIAAVAVSVHILLDPDKFLLRIQLTASTTDLIMAGISIILVLEACRRLSGMALSIVALVAILYAKFGYLLPGIFAHRGYTLDRILRSTIGPQGILGGPMNTVATTIFPFLMFAAFLSICGADQVFMDIAMALTGKKMGGPAKMAVVASATMGMVSGSAVANVVTTGAFTIPLMKRTGYDKAFAGGVEAVASTGGQLTPPIMGAAAFILSEMTGAPYLQVCLAAAVPAFMYYAVLFISVDIEAKKKKLGGLDESEVPKLKDALRGSAKLIIPLVVLTVELMVFRRTPARCAVYATISMIVIALFDKKDRFTWKKLKDGFVNSARSGATIVAACGTAGIIISVLSMTGLGLKLSNVLFSIGSHNLALALILAMIICIFLGMGLPTTAAYIVVASTLAPAFIQMGLPVLVAHMFLMYFSTISCITPPVAIASYAAASLAEASVAKVSIVALKLGITAFIVPYVFVINPAMLLPSFATAYDAFYSILTLVSSFALCYPISMLMWGTSKMIGQNKLQNAMRLIFVIPAFLLIHPAFYFKIAGFVITMAYVIYLKVGDRKRIQAV